MADVEDIVAELKMEVTKSRHLRRRVEEYEYWRKRAGWFDDDISMMEFNNGVYDTYYQIDDDVVAKSGTSSTGTRVQHDHKGLATFLKVGSVLVAVAILILLYRAISRRMSSGKSSKSKKSSSGKSSKSRSDSKSRSGRTSSSRSRAGRSSSSRSRSGRSRSGRKSSSTGASNYELMDDKTDTQSRKSSRSRSRSRRSRSRAGSRSRSKSKSRASEKEVVLV